MYKLESTGQTLATHADIRAAFPNTSLPAELTDSLLADLGVVVDTSVTAPVTPPAAPVLRVPALSGLLALDTAGLAGYYTAWAESEDRTFAERAFIDKATHWRSDDPVLRSAAAALGISDEQLMSLFLLAETFN
jgi:hypothetical protein